MHDIASSVALTGWVMLARDRMSAVDRAVRNLKKRVEAMTDLTSGNGAKKAVASAAEVASKIIDRADRDVALVVQLVGESQYLLVRHFETFIEGELARRGVVYGDHLLLRPLVETHGRELAEFVLSGVAIHHRFGLSALEKPAGDPLRLLRSDLWDSIRSHTEDAERHFVSEAGGLPKIISEVEQNLPKMVRRTAD